MSFEDARSYRTADRAVFSIHERKMTAASSCQVGDVNVRERGDLASSDEGLLQLETLVLIEIDGTNRRDERASSTRTGAADRSESRFCYRDLLGTDEDGL
jgi:hypothetical protein